MFEAAEKPKHAHSLYSIQQKSADQYQNNLTALTQQLQIIRAPVLAG
jgi:hypothetical protein